MGNSLPGPLNGRFRRRIGRSCESCCGVSSLRFLAILAEAVRRRAAQEIDGPPTGLEVSPAAQTRVPTDAAYGVQVCESRDEADTQRSQRAAAGGG